MPSPTSNLSYVAAMLALVVVGIWVASACWSSKLDYDRYYTEAHASWSEEGRYIQANCLSKAAKLANDRTRRNCEEAERIYAVQPSSVALQKVLRDWSLCSLIDCDHTTGHLAESFTKIVLLLAGLFVVFTLLGCTGLARSAHASYGQYWQLPHAASAPSPYPPSYPYGAYDAAPGAKSTEDALRALLRQTSGGGRNAKSD